MHFNDTIPPVKETQWAAFLNGEPDISDAPNQGLEKIDGFTSVWEQTGNNFSFSEANPDQAWLTLQKKIAKTDNGLKLNLFNRRILKYAALIVVALGVGFIAYQTVQNKGKQSEIPVRMVFTQTEAHPSNLTLITLPDGSTVKINASSRIEFPESFGGGIRKVKLSGEAYFEVVSDMARPFIIETENASVEVLGTSFNVSAYPISNLVEVNVKTGKVKLTQYTEGKSAGKTTILPAGSRGWLKVAEGEISQAGMLAPNYSSWITKEISFQRTPLAEAFSVLENTYHVRVKMENSEIGTILYTANFADLKLDYIVQVIARTHNLNVKKNGDEIIFARKVN